MNQELLDVVIVGGGPAGLTAGLYAARANLRAVLVERLLPDALQAGSASGHTVNGDPTSPKLAIGERREVRGFDCDGSPLSLELTLSETRLVGRPTRITVVRDITNRKRADQRLLRADGFRRGRLLRDPARGLGRRVEPTTCDRLSARPQTPAELADGGGR